MKLYGYWRSGATYRLRIALALKGLSYEYAPVNLLKDEQKSPSYLKVSPQGLLPAFVAEGGATLTQSLAIIEYLDELYPSPPLLPKQPIARAQARQIAYAIACEAQPLQNLRTQKYLKALPGFDDDAMRQWLDTWVGGAMKAVDEMIGEAGGAYCVGDEPTRADICLVPQVYAALRFGVDLSGLDRLNAIYERCVSLDAFKKAHPDEQSDAVKA